jgi:hypothetical protein
MGFRDVLNVAAGSRLISPQGEQRPDLIDREAKFAGPSDKPQFVDVVVAIIAIAVLLSRRGPQQPDGFVVADHLGSHA